LATHTDNTHTLHGLTTETQLKTGAIRNLLTFSALPHSVNCHVL